LTSRNRTTIRGACVALLGALIFGCSPMPTGPASGGREATGAPSGTGVKQVRVIAPDPPVSVVPGPSQPQPDTLVRVDPVEGADGGRVEVGYVRLDIPEGAFEGEAQVRILIPDKDKMECHLDIFPASKNQFAEPVTLTFDVEDVEDPEELAIWLYDETLQDWVQLRTLYHPERKTLKASLTHFSLYRAAKASWNKASWWESP
jgi:hypothetical protein